VTSEPVVLDTDVASLSLKGMLSPDVLRLLGGRVPLITFVTLAELTRWVEQRQWGAHRRELLARWLVGKHVLHSDDDVARTWGAITAYAYLRGRPGRRMTRG
jgi:predicted nucleic acid-binding protein